MTICTCVKNEGLVTSHAQILTEDEVLGVVCSVVCGNRVFDLCCGNIGCCIEVGFHEDNYTSLTVKHKDKLLMYILVTAVSKRVEL